jgi:tRNA(fMet)-specific endonuclease VapC
MGSLEYLLDTNICIYISKKAPLSVLEKFSGLSVGQVGMSCITYGELLYGAEKSQRKVESLAILKNLIGLVPVLEMGAGTSNYYATIRAYLTSTGNIIGNNDLWIAAHCLDLGTTLITHNTREFDRVPGLKVENWV